MYVCDSIHIRSGVIAYVLLRAGAMPLRMCQRICGDGYCVWMIRVREHMSYLSYVCTTLQLPHRSEGSMVQYFRYSYLSCAAFPVTCLTKTSGRGFGSALWRPLCEGPCVSSCFLCTAIQATHPLEIAFTTSSQWQLCNRSRTWTMFRQPVLRQRAFTCAPGSCDVFFCIP